MSRTGSPARYLLVCAALVGLSVSPTYTAPVSPLDNGAGSVVCRPSTGHCYEYVAGPLNWNAAKAAAESMEHNGVSGHLATMTSQDEINFIVASLPDAVAFRGVFDGGAYIGAFQLPGSVEPGGGWQWVTGEPWDYANWAWGEPSNSGPENVAHFWSTGGAWNDATSTLAKGYLVEYPAKLPSDLVIGKAGEHGHTGNIAMLFSDGSGGFTKDTIGINVYQSHEVAVGDLNKDGTDDVVVLASGGQVHVALGGFSDGLQNADLVPAGAFIEGPGNCCDRTRVLQLGDVNNDGKLDIVVTMWAHLGVMLGNGDGTFGSPILTNATAFDTRGMALGDLDGDGKIDIVANVAGNCCWWLAFHKGNGDGTFQPGVIIPNSTLAIPNIFLRDADGDGDLDIYTGALNSRLKIFTNGGSANFTVTTLDPGLGLQGRPLVVDDLNGDGTPDVVASIEANGFTTVRIWFSNGTGGFVTADHGPVGASPYHGAVADFNKDGIKDIAMVTAGSGSGGVWILRGTGPGTFAAPYSVPGYRNNYTIAAGNFKNPASPAPVACAAGSYSATGNEPCTLAGLGYYVPGTGAASQTACLIGSYSSIAGATSCTLAPAGSYVDTTAGTGPLTCDAGSFSATEGSASCTLAAPGFYVPSIGQTSPTACAVGTYSNATGATECTAAAPGFFVPTTGSSSQTACAVGYGSDGGATQCYLIDSDGDGVGDHWDAFPTNPAETKDTDGDGVGDNGDPYPHSNLSATVSVGACSTGVTNRLLPNGATFNDLLATAAAGATNHGKLVSAVSQLSNGWKNAGLISGRDHGAITSCVARSK